jgi:hypothetical protein
MIFPNGTIKEGYFENNIYKGKIEPSMSPSNDLNRTIRGSNMMNSSGLYGNIVKGT